MSTTISRSNEGVTWDASKQQQYLAQAQQDALRFHFLLDASGSMAEYAEALRKAYNQYLRYLQRQQLRYAVCDTRCFGSTLQAATLQPLTDARELHPETYRATYGGTALYDALGTVCTTAEPIGQHILMVYTDGQDNESQVYTAPKVHEVLTTLQDAGGWLAIFLGAFDEALTVAQACGFRPGNVLVFPNEKLPAAFHQFREAMQRYLDASPAQRKQLQQGGIF